MTTTLLLKKRAYLFGKQAETRALTYLKQQQLQCIARNYRKKMAKSI